jgi:phage major head subunit gpT-like protein
MKPKQKPMLDLNEIKKMSESDSWTRGDGKVVQINKARESNVKAIQKNLWENEEMMSLRNRFHKITGFDMADTKEFPVHEAGFSWNAVAKKCGFPSVKSALREADSSSTFVQVLRAGIQNLVNSMYQTVDTTFESWVSTINSTKDTELHAPLHGVSFLREVGRQEVFGESHAAGLDIKLKNRKYGTMFAVEWELLEDDQTGQFAKQAGLLGEYAKLALEVIVYAKLAGKFTGGVQANYVGLIVPATETQPSYEANYPWTSSSAPLRGGAYNRPTSFGTLTQNNIQNGIIALMQQPNLLGIKMQVNPKRILISPYYRFDAAVLLNSSFYPSQGGITAGAPSSNAGTTGNVFAINPIESVAALTVTRFMFTNATGSVGSAAGNSTAWYLIDDTKPWFVTQIREAASVVQEAPNSGESFDRDIIRWRLRLRTNSDHIDPRFAWQGSDGTA